MDKCEFNCDTALHRAVRFTEPLCQAVANHETRLPINKAARPVDLSAGRIGRAVLHRGQWQRELPRRGQHNAGQHRHRSGHPVLALLPHKGV